MRVNLLSILICSIVFQFVVLISINPSFAEDSAWEKHQVSILQNTDSVQVDFSDSVKGGCWSSPRATKSLVEKNLLQSGIKLGEENSVTLSIQGVGFMGKNVGGIETGCNVYISIEAYYFNPAISPNNQIPIRTKIQFFSDGVILAGGNDAQSRVNEFAKGVSDRFIVLWLKGR